MNPEVGGCSWLPEWREVLSVVGLLPSCFPGYNVTFVFLRNRT
jgi:hypothetical protein